MRVAVTGGRGRLGRYVTDALARDHELRILDRAAPAGGEAEPVLDVLDAASVKAALRDQEVIVHLAAIDSSVAAPPELIFDTNVRGTWNVFQAAEEVGARRVVLCSSSAVLGLAPRPSGPVPLYLPIDEDHPVLPVGAYALSKFLGEQIAAAFARRGVLEVLVLRPPYIAFPETMDFLAGRSDGPAGRAPEPLPYLRSYVAPEDVARAFARAVACDNPGFAAFWVAAADTFSAEPTLDVMRHLYGALPALRKPDLYHRFPRAAALDIERAGRILGWVPELTWPELVKRAAGEQR
jgi:UDP-glucose 4-epimerase